LYYLYDGNEKGTFLKFDNKWSVLRNIHAEQCLLSMKVRTEIVDKLPLAAIKINSRVLMKHPSIYYGTSGCLKTHIIAAFLRKWSFTRLRGTHDFFLFFFLGGGTPLGVYNIQTSSCIFKPFMTQNDLCKKYVQETSYWYTVCPSNVHVIEPACDSNHLRDLELHGVQSEGYLKQLAGILGDQISKILSLALGITGKILLRRISQLARTRRDRKPRSVNGRLFW